MANPADGARKKIHGGSGTSGNGDAYGPDSAFSPNFIQYVQVWDPSFYFKFSRRIPGISQCGSPSSSLEFYLMLTSQEFYQLADFSFPLRREQGRGRHAPHSG